MHTFIPLFSFVAGLSVLIVQVYPWVGRWVSQSGLRWWAVQEP